MVQHKGTEMVHQIGSKMGAVDYGGCDYGECDYGGFYGECKYGEYDYGECDYGECDYLHSANVTTADYNNHYSSLFQFAKID